MENGTKALLIASSVLISILSIAFGTRIFNSTGEYAKDIQKISNTLNSETESVTELASGELSKALQYSGNQYNDLKPDEIMFYFYLKNNNEFLESFIAKKKMTWASFLAQRYDRNAKGSFSRMLNTDYLTYNLDNHCYYVTLDSKKVTGNNVIQSEGKYELEKWY